MNYWEEEMKKKKEEEKKEENEIEEESHKHIKGTCCALTPYLVCQFGSSNSLVNKDMMSKTWTN